MRGLIVFIACFCFIPGFWNSLAQPTNRSEASIKVSFLNATGKTNPLFVVWSGQEAFPEGLPSGKSCGPLLFPGGTVPLTVRAEGMASAKDTVALAPGTKMTLLFTKQNNPEAKKEEEKESIKVHQITSPDQKPERGHAWPLVFAGPSEVATVLINGQTVRLEREKLLWVAKGESLVRIQDGQEPILTVSVQKPSDHLLVIFGSEIGKLSGAVVYR